MIGEALGGLLLSAKALREVYFQRSLKFDIGSNIGFSYCDTMLPLVQRHERAEYLRQKISMISKDRIVAAFDGIAPHVAILDAAGKIVHVNEAWRLFAVENECPDPEAYVGQNYLDIIRQAASAGDELAGEAVEGIAAVLSGRSQRFSQKYPCHAPGVERWFVMTVTRVSRGSDIVIAHDAVTPLVRAERASAAAEERLKHSLDAGQMGTFEVDLDKEEIVFDRQEAKLLGLPGDLNRLSLADFNRMLIAPDTDALRGEDCEGGRPLRR